MQAVLSFKKNEIPKVQAFLAGFDEQSEPHRYELMRCKVNESILILFESGKLLIQGKNSEPIKERILKELSGNSNELILGIDETGRGENTGDFCMAGVLGRTSDLREVRDSKKTSDVFEKKKIVLKKMVNAVVVCYPAETIDALRNEGVNLNQMEGQLIDWICDFFQQNSPKPDKIIVDGGYLPVQNKKIDFLPRADDLEPVVSAASILARAARLEGDTKTVRKTWKTKNTEGNFK